MFLPRLFIALACALPSGAYAHEFWIESSSYQVAPGENLQGVFKNGEEFKGSTLSFFDRVSARFDMVAGDKTTVLEPRSGDSPALNAPAPIEDGLVSVVHETTPSVLTYSEWQKFLNFAKHKDFATAEADHIANGWPQDKFRERYTRHVKALYGVGSGEGADSDTGMATEFVALTNPYAADFGEEMQVELLYQGAPRPDAQVEVFERAPDDTVTVTLYRTDAEGRASIPVKAGHDYLLDAVVLRPVAEPVMEENPLLWETLWAALTFKVPQ